MKAKGPGSGSKRKGPDFEEIAALEGQIDVLETLYVTKGYSVRRLAKRFRVGEEAIRQTLRAVGLEVEGRVKSGLVPSGRAVSAEGKEV
jgi:transcriptional regulator of aromatic amino acid metabolism